MKKAVKNILEIHYCVWNIAQIYNTPNFMKHTAILYGNWNSPLFYMSSKDGSTKSKEIIQKHGKIWCLPCVLTFPYDSEIK